MTADPLDDYRESFEGPGGVEFRTYPTAGGVGVLGVDDCANGDGNGVKIVNELSDQGIVVNAEAAAMVRLALETAFGDGDD